MLYIKKVEMSGLKRDCFRIERCLDTLHLKEAESLLVSGDGQYLDG